MPNFDILNYPRTLTHKRVTPSSHNQGTGEFVPGATVSTPIKGHLVDATLEQVQRSGGILSLGDRVLATSANMTYPDIIEVTEDDGSVTSWQVKQRLHKMPLFERLNIKRSAYAITKYKV